MSFARSLTLLPLTLPALSYFKQQHDMAASLTVPMESSSCPSFDVQASLFEPPPLRNLSLHGRLRRFPRLRILVQPLLWTPLHLELLGCVFTGPSPAPDAAMQLSYPDDARFQARCRRELEKGCKQSAFAILLAAGGSQLPLCFLYVCCP